MLISQSVADDYDFIEFFSNEWLKGHKTLSVSKLKKLHPSIRREAIRLIIEKYVPSLRDIESGHIEEVSKVVKSSKSKKQRINLKGLKIERKGDKLVISKS